MKHSALLLALALVQFGTGLRAQVTLELNLLEAQTYALENNYDVRISDMQVQLAKERVKEAVGFGLPQINASVGFTNYLDIPTQIFPDFISPTVVGTLLEYDVIDDSDVMQGDAQFVEAQFGTEFNTTASISASQLLFDGSYIVGLQAAKTYVEFAELDKNRTEATIRDNAAQSYFTALISGENVKVLEDSQIQLESVLRETEAFYENGFLEEQDVDQLKLQLANLRNQVDFAKRQKELAYDLLKFTLGVPPEIDLILNDDPDKLLNDVEFENLVNIAFALEENPNVRLAQSGVALSELSEKLEKSSYMPSLNAFFQHDQQNLGNELNLFGGDANWFPATYWGLNLSIPIWSSGMRKHKVQQAQIEVEKSMVQQQQISDASKLEYRTARSEFLNANAQYENYTKTLTLAERILEKTRIKYREGIDSSTDLAIAEQQFLSNQGSYIASMLQLLNAKSKLKKALNQY